LANTAIDAPYESSRGEAFKFPQEIKDAIKGLDNSKRWKIIECLIENGETSFSKLMKELNIHNKGILTFHLEILSRSGLVRRYEKIGKDTGEKSFYDISSFGRIMVNSLGSTLDPSVIEKEKDELAETWGSLYSSSHGMVAEKIIDNVNLSEAPLEYRFVSHLAEASSRYEYAQKIIDDANLSKDQDELEDSLLIPTNRVKALAGGGRIRNISTDYDFERTKQALITSYNEYIKTKKIK
jgi:predicted transcriptional regulator